MVGGDRKSLFRVPFEGGEFGEPAPYARVEDAYILDTAGVSDGRVLLILQDPEEEEMNRIGVVMGALARD